MKSVRFPKELHDELQRLAKLDDRSFSSLVVRLLSRSVEPQSVHADYEIVSKGLGVSPPAAASSQASPTPPASRAAAFSAATQKRK